MSSTALRVRTRLAAFDHITGVLFNDTPAKSRQRCARSVKYAANFCCEGGELRGAEQLSRSGTGKGNVDDRRDTARTRRQDDHAVTQKDRFSNTVGYK